MGEGWTEGPQNLGKGAGNDTEKTEDQQLLRSNCPSGRKQLSPSASLGLILLAWQWTESPGLCGSLHGPSVSSPALPVLLTVTPLSVVPASMPAVFFPSHSCWNSLPCAAPYSNAKIGPVSSPPSRARVPRKLWHVRSRRQALSSMRKWGHEK